jgi:hypothetical protein
MIRSVSHKGADWGCCISFQAFAIALMTATVGYAQTPPAGGQVSIPGSSIEKPRDIGKRGHTNFEIFIPNRGANGAQSPPRGAGSAVPEGPDAERAGGSARPQ